PRSATRRLSAGRARGRSSRRGASRRSAESCRPGPSPWSLASAPHIGPGAPSGQERRISSRAVATIDTALLQTEYRTLREACGLIDRSERGKLALTGSQAVEFLNGQVTNELADLRPGEGRYAAFLTHKGKMLGDVRILAVGEHASGAPSGLLLDTE